MRILFTLTVLAAWMSGCMLHDVKEDRASPAKVPDAYSTSGDSKRSATPWWKELQSPGFEAYVNDLLTQNFDLKRGYARVKQMQAIA